MALRDQPYLPLYVQDYLTDEKLNMCSAASQGIYIKIMCLFHKSETYGGILLKQKDKQKENICLDFASRIAKVLPFSLLEIEEAITELLEEGVLIIEGDFLFQKRMRKDGEISDKRAFAGKKGGIKTQVKNSDFASEFDKAKTKAKLKQNTESESENEIEIEDGVKKEYLKGGKIKNDFTLFWNTYDKKVGDKSKCEKKWNKLSLSDQEKIISTLPAFMDQFTNKQYQPFPETYLNQKRWNDDLTVKIDNKTLNQPQLDQRFKIHRATV